MYSRLIFRLLLILLVSLSSGILFGQEYTKNKIRSTIRNTVNTIERLQSLAYTIDYYDVSYFKNSYILADSFHKNCTGFIKFVDSDEISAYFNLNIFYDDSTSKKVVYDGNFIYTNYKHGGKIKNQIVDVDKKGYRVIFGSDVSTVLYNQIFDEIQGLNSLFGRLLTDKLAMKDTMYAGKSCYKVSIYFKSINKGNRIKDVINTYIIDKENYLPLAYKYQGVWEGLKIYELYKVQYNAINPELNDSIFNFNYVDKIIHQDKKQNNQRDLKDKKEFTLDNIVSENIPLVNGDTVVLSELKGKLIILDFWYRRCPPCIKLMPKLNKLYEKYKEEGVIVIGINDIDSKESITKYFNLKNYSYPSSFKNPRNLSKTVGINSFPTTIIIGQNGEIIKELIGYEKGVYSKIHKIIREEIED